MSNLVWNPQSMSFPADRLASSYYPFVVKYGVRNRASGGCAGSGINAVYPQYLNHCQTCDGKPPGNDFCQGQLPYLGYMGSFGYFSVNNTPFFDLEYNAVSGLCDPQKGCLSPNSPSYNKLASQHCQPMCDGMRPKVCIGEGVTPSQFDKCECATDEYGETAAQAIYSKRKDTRRTDLAKHVNYLQGFQA